MSKGNKTMRINKINAVAAAANVDGGAFPCGYINPARPNNSCTREKAIQLAIMLNDNGIIQGWAETQQNPIFEYEFAIWESMNPNASADDKENHRLYLLGACHPDLELAELVKLRVTGN